MTNGDLELDERLRDLLANWDDSRSPSELLALGHPALRRLLDKETKGSLWRVGVDPRDYQYAEAAAFTTFGRDDLDGVLAEMRKRGWSDPLIAQYVGYVRDPRVVSALLELYSSRFPGSRAAAVHCLGVQRDPRATEALVRALSDRSSDVQYAAVDSLGEAGDPTAIEPLRDFAKHARKDWVARHARSTIAKIQKTVRSSKKKKS